MHTKNIPNILLFVALTAGLLAGIAQAAPVRAQAGSAAELLSAVNAYRTQYGLAPYEIDAGLMDSAQQHSNYQASIQTCTHQRADGSGPGDYGISSENIACGMNLSVDGAIYRQWADELHTATMLGPDTGRAGAGVAYAGNMVYYTLQVKRLSGDFTYRPPIDSSQGGTGGPQNQQGNAPLFQDLFATATPNADGSIAHIVKYGETLTGIAEAYGISLSDLIGINKLDPAKPEIFAGQALIIRLAFTPTPFITMTFTPRPPTRTPLPSRTPRPTRTPTVFVTPEPTVTPTRTPLVRLPTIESLGPMRPILAYTFIAISAIGLLVLVFTSFLPGRRE